MRLPRMTTRQLMGATAIVAALLAICEWVRVSHRVVDPPHWGPPSHTLVPKPVPVTPRIDPNGEEIFARRESFFPHRDFPTVPGIAVGLLVSDADLFTGITEARGGQRDAVEFSADGGSYRWVYLPALDGEKPEWDALRVGVSGRGRAEILTAHDLVFSRDRTVQTRGITKPYALVRAMINDGLGSPARDSSTAGQLSPMIVLRDIEVLDGTKDYPIRTAEVISDLRRRYDAHLRENSGRLDSMLREAREGVPAVSAHRTEELTLMYVTWMTRSERLRVRFRTRVRYRESYDCAYRPLEQSPQLHLIGPVRDDHPPGEWTPSGDDEGHRTARTGPSRPAIPKSPSFSSYVLEAGVELGIEYEVTKTGVLDRIRPLPALPYWVCF